MRIGCPPSPVPGPALRTSKPQVRPARQPQPAVPMGGDLRAALGYSGTMDLAVQHARHAAPADELIAVGAIAAELDRLAASRSGGDGELRTAVAQQLKSAL